MSKKVGIQKQRKLVEIDLLMSCYRLIGDLWGHSDIYERLCEDEDEKLDERSQDVLNRYNNILPRLGEIILPEMLRDLNKNR